MAILLLLNINCSGVNTPIPKIQIAYTESTASASLKSWILNDFQKISSFLTPYMILSDIE